MLVKKLWLSVVAVLAALAGICFFVVNGLPMVAKIYSEDAATSNVAMTEVTWVAGAILTLAAIMIWRTRDMWVNRRVYLRAIKAGFNNVARKER